MFVCLYMCVRKYACMCMDVCICTVCVDACMHMYCYVWLPSWDYSAVIGFYFDEPFQVVTSPHTKRVGANHQVVSTRSRELQHNSVIPSIDIHGDLFNGSKPDIDSDKFSY